MFLTKRKRAAASLFGLLVLAVGVEVAGEAKSDNEKEAAARKQSVTNLKKIVLAMHLYHDVMGTFPPAAVMDNTKKQLLSWRVLLLPYLGEHDLFKQFKITEPWDSPHNRKLLAKIPKVYAPAGGKGGEPGTTYYQVFTGKGTAFEGIRGLALPEFPDGTSNTLLVIEAGKPVPWTKPADLAYDPKKPLPKVGGLFADVIHIGMADGSVRTAEKGYRKSVLRLMITRNDGMAMAELNPERKGPEVHPDRLAFGTVYTGATVEASFRVSEPGDDANIKLAVTAPEFVKVLKAIRPPQLGLDADNIEGIVEIAIDTASAGEWKGEVHVTLGQTKVKVPVSATVKPRRPGVARLLIAETPFHRFSTEDGGQFKAWTDLANGTPLDVSSLLVTRGKPVFRDLDLSKFDCLLVADSGLVSLTAADIKKVRAFAQSGGRVVVAASRCYGGTVKQANAVLANYGLQLRDEESREQSDVILRKGDFDPHVVKAGVESAHFFRASPVAVTDTKAGRVLAKAVGVGQAGDGFVAIAKAGKGEVIALGQSLWWHWITDNQAAGTDNAKLLRWLLLPPNKP